MSRREDAIPRAVNNAKTVARFWRYVQKTETCWLWTRSLSPKGYGKFCIVGCTCEAHRFSWALLHGLPPHGICVLHNCPDGDNPSCVNPAHLWLGTKADNNADMWAKGRQVITPADQRSNARLNNDLVREIRARIAGGATQRGLSRELGIPEITLRRAASRQSWKHVS